MTLKFVDHDVVNATRGRNAKHVTPTVEAELRKHPGRWALLYEEANDSTRTAVFNWVKRHRPEFEFAAHRSETTREKRFEIYIRYVGEQ